jgi:hypothetical protein
MGEHKKAIPEPKVGEIVTRVHDGVVGTVSTWRGLVGLSVENPGCGWSATESSMLEMELHNPGFTPFIRKDNGCASWDWTRNLKPLRPEKPIPKLEQLTLFGEVP